MTSKPENVQRVCAKCGTSNRADELGGRDYRCTKCGLELAHVDVTNSGVVRGIFGWLRSAGEIVSDRYRIKSVLGKGGFGVTYLVEDLRLNGKRRALKEVPELLFDEQETQLLSRLSHPGIPDITDRSLCDGMVYFVLEFGGTRTLSDEKRRLNGRIPFASLLPWMRELCEVLAYLHSQNPPVIHRDLKPENVLINDDNHIMLIDFGIAKENDPSIMTRTLGRAATHGFSSPEQMLGSGTDHRTDIYSLAATFYALVTGVPPIGADERISGKELITPSALAPDIPANVDQALIQALNLNRNERQQHVSEVLRALNTSDPPATEPSDHQVTPAAPSSGGAAITVTLDAANNTQGKSSRAKTLPLILSGISALAIFATGYIYVISPGIQTPKSAYDLASRPHNAADPNSAPAERQGPAADSRREYEPLNEPKTSKPLKDRRVAERPASNKRTPGVTPSPSPVQPDADWSGSMQRGSVNKSE